MQPRFEYQYELGSSIDSGFFRDPINYPQLKNEITQNGPVMRSDTETGVRMILDISPCLCGFDGCTEDVISLAVQHGTVSFRSLIQKSQLLEFESLDHFCTAFLAFPETFYSSSADEQQIEAELASKLGLNIWNVFKADGAGEEMARQFSQMNDFEADWWQTYNLLPLVRLLHEKRKLLRAIKATPNEGASELAASMKRVFDLGFLAGRLWSEYRTKDNFEEVIGKGEASVKAQALRTEASGKRAAQKRRENLEHLMTEIEALSAAVGLISEDRIFAQAFERCRERYPSMPASKKSLDAYAISLRSETPFKERYQALFWKSA